MRTETKKSILDEVGFVVIAVLTMVVITVIIFPLFIIALPVILIAGCRHVWYVDHLK